MFWHLVSGLSVSKRLVRRDYRIQASLDDALVFAPNSSQLPFSHPSPEGMKPKCLLSRSSGPSAIQTSLFTRETEALGYG